MFRWILMGLMLCSLPQAQQKSLPVVSMADVKQESMTPILKVPGTVSANNGANLGMEDSGVISKISVASGQMVKKGELLIELDNSSQRASYESALVSKRYAEVEYERQKKLYAEGVVSTDTFQQSQTQLASAQSSLVAAQVALDHRQLRAPYDGRVGIITLSVGQYVSAGTSLLSLLDLSNMRVDFSISQEKYNFVRSGLTFSIDNPIQEMSGQISAMSPVVDSSSGQLAVQGLFQNVDQKLPSGLLVDVSINLDPVANQILIPPSAINYSLAGDYVYVLDDIKTSGGKTTGLASQVLVEVGEIGKTQAVIKSGLKAGQKVVSAGAVKLTGNGVAVEVDNQTPLPS